MGVFILTIISRHRKKQIAYQQILKEMEANYEKNLLKTQLEIQEQTFINISREIHDNISLSLTLAKLHLHTLDWNNKEKLYEKVDTSINLLSTSISGLRDISKGLNADVIIQHGLIKALEEEMYRIRQTGMFLIDFDIKGIPEYMDHQKELIIFRIIQEAFNNIIKHSGATKTKLILHFNASKLTIVINDNGNGFYKDLTLSNRQAGLKNMETRIRILKGEMKIESKPGTGTILSFTISL
ncbi:MAG: ATP-binding protein [Chitinophagaceae bacterium]